MTLIKHYAGRLKEAIFKSDWVLLLLCLITTGFGLVIVASATNYLNSFRYIGMQLFATLIGVFAYAFMSSLDVDFLMEKRFWLMLFNIGFLSMLIPFGQTIGGNRSWLSFPFLPFNIQVAEVCKVTYILIMASVMNAHKEKISSWRSIIHMGFHIGLLFLINQKLSSDLGVSLIFIFIFIVMAFTGGVRGWWFLGGAAMVAILFPFIWPRLDGYQRMRIEVLFNPALDPTGTGVLWQTNLSLRSLTGGGLFGQGLFSGYHTQNGNLQGQHTDFIFSTVGEELGYVGCVLVLLLIALIIGRCIWVGLRSQEYSRRLICFGAAAALIFQTLINIGMCTGIGPVIGLTLPFISYGATSIVSLYAMLGLVSGVFARPTPTSHERYIRYEIRS